ncbi:nucleotide pyrophosphohydrolase [Candidatus Woesearchaeota archaeon]|jgi:dCTP diphosphatase|nr:nucleotide pyrophosphohydrolase [Candidatus Woesearchaeota archaeon]MBT5271773.1 nucleotide pyrophosphohydrolase [Candidatus Woesearchaeota archaeon]MBT6041186.1 nucleotide pyrophosphohydrolase [Candidatus Woesearchaeota archaeon]MBT6336307.1 nucleotide pyrophosphohydrolase [Candidatus Woesearchaeota archaeon]MBT7927307.1 nucleotide pyrophosphohydrolase [Candidatus Woesearchaeota archaeon]
MEETRDESKIKSSGNIKTITKKIIEFRDLRDWKQFHHPKDLAIGLSIEVGEILEHFRFKTNDEIKEYLKNSDDKKKLSHELADTLYFLLTLANETEINISKALHEKLEIIEKKYPIEKCKGKPHKYTHYEK